MCKIVFLESLGISVEQLKSIMRSLLPEGIEADYYGSSSLCSEELISRSSDADIVVLSQIPLSAEVISQCTNLKAICVAFTGTDHIDIEYCKEHNIAVYNCAGYSNSAVADLVFGDVIMLARNIISCDRAIRKGGTKNGLVGFELEGKVFGIIGAGAIGSRVASIANAFGCNVIAYNRSTKELPGVEFVDMDTLLEKSDIVSLHVPLNNSTRGLIGAQELAKMKSSALLINTSRGPVIDNKALAEALNDGVIAGAAVDVFEMEPPIPEDYPLLDAPNSILTPHVAFATEQAFIKRANIVGANLKAHIEGKPQNKVI